MDHHPLAAWTRTAITLPARRDVLRGLVGVGLGIGAVRLSVAADARTGKKRHNKKGGKRKKSRKPILPPLDFKPRIDASCLVLGGSGQIAFAGNQRIAHSFTALASGPLVTAQLAIGQFAESMGDYVLRLAPLDSAGIPTNGVLAEATVANANVPVGESAVTFGFGAPAPVVAGAQYALVLTRPGGSSFAWLGPQGGRGCLGRAFTSASQTDPFAPLDNLDLHFMTFVIS
jgi:hypothetical protein